MGLLGRRLTGSHHNMYDNKTGWRLKLLHIFISWITQCFIYIKQDAVCWSFPELSSLQYAVQSLNNEYQLWLWRCSPRRPVNKSRIPQCSPHLLSSPRGVGSLKRMKSFCKIKGTWSSLKSTLPCSFACLQAYSAEKPGRRGKKKSTARW